MGQGQHRFRSFEQKDGLSGNSVRCMLEDPKGFIWIANDNGLDRFDGRKFLNLRYDPQNPNSLNANRVNGLALDKADQLWIGTSNGLCRLNLHTGLIQRIELTQDEKETTYNILDVLVDSSGHIWVGTLSNGLLKLTPDSSGESMELQQFMPNDNGLSSPTIRRLLQVDRDYLWIGTTLGLDRLHIPSEKVVTVANSRPLIGVQGITDICKDQEGNIVYAIHREDLFYTDPKVEPLTAKPYLSPAFSNVFRSNYALRDVLQDRQGQFWLGDKSGVFVVDALKAQYEFLRYSSNPSTAVRYLLESRDGTIWVGFNTAGISRKSRSTSNYLNIQYDAEHPNSISKGQIRTMVEDQKGHLWVGYLEEGIDQFKWDEEEQALVKLRHIAYDPGQKGGLLSNNVIQILSDSEGFLWIGHNGAGLNRLDPESGKLESYLHDPDKPNSLSGNRIWGLSEDRKGYIWVGEFTTGLNRLDPNTGEVKRFSADSNNPNALSHNRVKATLVDSQGDLWIGTNEGLNRLNVETEKFTRFVNDPHDTNSLSNNLIWSIYEDSLHHLWVGTALGLNKLIGAVGAGNTAIRYERLYENDGLPSNTVLGIQGDDKGHLWVSTDKGIAQIIEEDKGIRVQALSNEDGLEYASFLSKSHYYSQQHQQFYFGTREHGLLVLPQQQDLVERAPDQLVVSSVSKYTSEEAEGKQWVDPFISSKGKWDITHKDRILTIELSAINWDENSRFEYQLTGFDANWRPLPEEMKLTYTDLAPGKYRLLGRPVVADGETTEEQLLLQMRVYPPWWETTWAYLLYFLSGIGLVYAIYRFQLRRQLEKQETENLRALDEFKNQLYTNITHEFKTPLTVIGGLTEQVIGQETIKQGIRRNSRNLLHLVNQILDLRKLELGKVKLDWVQTDVVLYFQYILESHMVLAEKDEVNLHFLPSRRQILMDLDKEKLLRILSNLLSNAIKFTPAGGDVYLSMELTSLPESTDQIKEGLRFSVRDTGVGIPMADQALIFDRFYQVNAGHSRDSNKGSKTLQYRGPGGGSGIGLAITKELVEVMGGEIHLTSKLGKGSTFTVFLPIKQTAPIEEIEVLEIPTPVMPAKGTLAAEPVLTTPTSNSDTAGLELLIVEDNDDVRAYLVSLLRNQYELHLAKDGQEGIEKALKIIPDIIVSDVMMPRKDGFQLLSELKADIRTSHIPIVMLTAKSSVESRIQGLKRGADAYLAKPFNQEELLIQLTNLLAIRHVLRKRYATIAGEAVSPSKEVVFEQEDAFIQQLKAVIEEHMADPNFGVAELCEAMGISRFVLHKKLKALADTNATYFIRTLRLHKASQLLLDKTYSVSEVADRVGFRHFSYFSTAFRKEFGVTPKAFRESLEKG